MTFETVIGETPEDGGDIAVTEVTLNDYNDVDDTLGVAEIRDKSNPPSPHASAARKTSSSSSAASRSIPAVSLFKTPAKSSIAAADTPTGDVLAKPKIVPNSGSAKKTVGVKRDLGASAEMPSPGGSASAKRIK